MLGATAVTIVAATKPRVEISSAAIGVPRFVTAVAPSTAYVYLLGVALFGGLFVWIMIFMTHLFFRRAWVRGGNAPLPVRMPGYPWLTLLGLALLTGILVSTWWVPGMRPTLIAGLPWLGLISAVYFFRRSRTARQAR